MKTLLKNNENLKKKGGANLQRDLETVGGYLYLTDSRLIFEPHILNIQKQPEIIDLNTITGVSKCWTKFLNLIPTFPNSIEITTTNGKFKFVVFNREEWMKQISELASTN